MTSNILPSGQYYIRNGDTFAGRNNLEDRSLGPKKVYCPTDHCGDPDLWIILALRNGRYNIRARGAPTGELDKLLYAFLIQEGRTEEWVITERETGGNRPLYTIENATKTAGWIAQTSSETPQIAVCPLIGTSGPPEFPPSELWNIQPLLD